ncbi:hypothetical protein JAAARDRAFT_445623 [Jaapia argillacea MUCL 33604]|uniref:PAP-associated domain-containing protein n=1 Tax=Jaapia argillacea MUCL 33604 TaxID=933084 RepID=A0A067PNK9_9AGAM|nr:hypothetical protein JAAARDRAFT_445623 [Jaapia argillacea MUCL 33604]
MIKVIKKWAKPLGLNSPGRGAVVSFSSYALVLLAIARLQMNGQLPNLQAGLPALQPDDKTGIWWISSRGGRKRTKCDARFAPNPQWVPKNPMVLKEALLDWFTFYGEKFVAADQLVSIRHGKLLPRPARSGEPDVEPVLEAEPNQEFEEDTPENLVENLEDDRFGLKRTSFDEVLIQPKVNEDVDDGDQTAEYEEDIPLERREDDSLTVIEDEDHIIHTQGWRNHAMIIIDPFVREKNVARNVGKAVVQRFIADCQRASKLLRSGMSLEELIGEEKHPSKRRESSNIVNPGMGGPVKFALDQLLGDMDKNSSKRREPSHTANPGKGKPGKVALDPHPKDMDKKRKEPSDTVNPGKGKPSNVALDHIDTKTRNRIMEKIRLASLAINRNRGSSRSEMDSVPSHPGLSTLHHHGTTDSLPASAPEPRMDAGLELKNAVEPPPSRPAFSDDESARLLNNELSKARARLGKQQ